MQLLEIANGIAVRRASRNEIPAIRDMQERSLTLLGADYYTAEEIAAFIAHVGTMDDAVVDEGHYFVAVDREIGRAHV